MSPLPLMDALHKAFEPTSKVYSRINRCDHRKIHLMSAKKDGIETQSAFPHSLGL